MDCNCSAHKHRHTHKTDWKVELGIIAFILLMVGAAYLFKN